MIPLQGVAQYRQIMSVEHTPQRNLGEPVEPERFEHTGDSLYVIDPQCTAGGLDPVEKPMHRCCLDEDPDFRCGVLVIEIDRAFRPLLFLADKVLDTCLGHWRLDVEGDCLTTK